MPTHALALVLVAGLIHTSWNIAAKKAGGDVRFATFTGRVLLVPTVLRDRAGAWVLWRQQWKYAVFVGVTALALG